MLVILELALVALVVVLLGLGAWAAWRALRGGALAGTAALPARDRAWLAAQIAAARWTVAHDELDGATRVLLRKGHAGLDGRPVVLEERVFETFRADDPAWEARFTEAMANARYRCAYLNAEESRE
ncbi:hypothetical protein ACI8AF_20830 [Blastococcus sp. SYSU D00669]